MTGVELILIAIGLSMDAFAVSICSGLSMRGKSWRKAAVVGGYYGFFQMMMPILGYLLAAQFAHHIESIDHWIAFALLAAIGANMIRESRKPEEEKCEGGGEVSLRIKDMVPSALATSVDALAIGVSFAFLQVSILPAALSIGAITFLLSMLGVRVGGMVGQKFQSKAELAGGLILICLGTKILLEHTGILA